MRLNTQDQPPSAVEIAARRSAARLTQAASAKACGVTLRTWQWWESGDRVMRFAYWSLYLEKTASRVRVEAVNAIRDLL